MKTAVVTGVSGQDGAYLTRLLLDKGYHVYGTLRKHGNADLWRLESLGVRHHPHLKLVKHELSSLAECAALMDRIQPHEVYHLAAQSSVSKSFEYPHATVNGIQQANLNLLEAIRQVTPSTRFFEAGTSEIFSTTHSTLCSEATPLHPRNPYGLAKLNTYWTTVNYRESFAVFGAIGILFNHESPLRDPHFVTRKITVAAAHIALGRQESALELGNLEARRDWGFAADYVEGMWRMLQAYQPDTFVLATRRAESVRDFVRLAFAGAGIGLDFLGRGEDEVAVVSDFLDGFPHPYHLKVGQVVVKVNPDFYRPVETDAFIGDASKAKMQLGWQASTTLEHLCQMMVAFDMLRASRESL